ncbi:P-loop containing nucleoside triphosphate hydrolase protein [Lentinula boryana]|uniref:P-loop containing nucleoside triphosphate hydrolase protein n=1 Tax=Lentinula boryana TaxID=40481 RepID=A0ABQ8QL41_9AGAR|nr:P-loop containing nucleoside triphosphate hydrolase protein [Lentinula boryana]
MLLKAFALLPNDLVTELASLGILTSTDLIFSSTTPLEIYSRLSSKSISFPEFEACIKVILTKLATSGQEAVELDQSSRSCFKMETLTSLDNYLDGGLPCARVIEISGDNGSGKRILLLNCVLMSLLRNREIEGLWIDTTGDFAIERAVQILEYHQQVEANFSSIKRWNDTEILLQRLYISIATDMESVQQIFRALDFQLALQASSIRMKYIVIDSVTSLFGPYLSAVSSQGHAIMAAFMRYLRDLAKRYSVIILLINNATLMQARSTTRAQTTAEAINPRSVFASTIRKPALGPSFTFMTDATLWVSLWPAQEEDEEKFTTHLVEVFRSKFSVSKYLVKPGGD